MINEMVLKILIKTYDECGDVLPSPSCGVNISQLIRFASVFSNASDVNNRNQYLTA